MTNKLIPLLLIITTAQTTNFAPSTATTITPGWRTYCGHTMRHDMLKKLKCNKFIPTNCNKNRNLYVTLVKIH